MCAPRRKPPPDPVEPPPPPDSQPEGPCGPGCPDWVQWPILGVLWMACRLLDFLFFLAIK